MSGENEIAAQVAKAKEAAESKAGKGAGQSGKAQRKDKRAFPFKVEIGQIWREVEDGKADDGRILKKWVALGKKTVRAGLHMMMIQSRPFSICTQRAEKRFSRA